MKYTLMDPALTQKWADLTSNLKPATPEHWESIFPADKFDSIVDFPGAYHWEALAAMYPDAKIVLSVRGADGWAKSFQTLEGFLLKITNALGLLRFVGISRFYKWRKFCEALHCSLFYGPEGRFIKSFPTHPSSVEMVERYDKWVAHVKATCPKERLLVFDVREGWAPLCKFRDACAEGRALPAHQRRRRRPLHCGLARDRVEPAAPLLRFLGGEAQIARAGGSP